MYLTPEQLYARTNGGYDIYRLYLGKVGKQMNRPWGQKENKPSWGIFPDGDTWYWKDQATEESGTAIQFVQRYFSLTYQQAMDKVSWDFGLGGKETNTAPTVVTWEKPDIERDYTKIQFTTQPFKKVHHNFWNIVEVSEDYCRKSECYAVKDAAINGARVGIMSGEAVFAYYAPEIDKVKLYFPERESGKKFKSNIEYHHLWNFENLQECEDLIIQKSNKDMIVTSMIFPCCTATMAEAVKIFDEDTVKRINSISKRPWIWYGSDWDGVKKCKDITDTHRWRYINTPKNLLPDVNDVYGFVKMYNTQEMGTGLKELRNFMKLKKLI